MEDGPVPNLNPPPNVDVAGCCGNVELDEVVGCPRVDPILVVAEGKVVAAEGKARVEGVEVEPGLLVKLNDGTELFLVLFKNEKERKFKNLTQN